jgi:hypothetical protein
MVMEVRWAPTHHPLWLKREMLLTGHRMVVVLLSSLLTSYTDATRCLPATSIRCVSCGELLFCQTISRRRFPTMLSFVEQSIRQLSEESHGKALTCLTMDRDPTMRLHGWKVHTKSGIGTLGCSSRICWRTLSFRTSLITRHFDNTMLMVIANMKTLCRAIGLGNRL